MFAFSIEHASMDQNSFRIKRTTMTFFRTAVIAAGMLFTLPLFDIRSSCVQAKEATAKGVDAAVAAPAITPAEAVSADTTEKVKKKAVVKRKKKRKKSAKKTTATIVEDASTGKLTINQVMDVLKTTRDFSGKSLSGLRLVGINLGKCNLKGADLSHANLERADLGESDLERADLTGANLKMANLRLSGMIGANLDGAILDGAIWKDGRICAAGSSGLCRDLASQSFVK